MLTINIQNNSCGFFGELKQCLCDQFITNTIAKHTPNKNTYLYIWSLLLTRF